MTRKEREQTKQEIAYRDYMTKRMGKFAKLFASFFLLALAITVWGFSGWTDNFMSFAEGARNTIKWIALVIAIPTGVLALMFWLSYRNSKKYTIGLIDDLKIKK